MFEFAKKFACLTVLFSMVAFSAEEVEEESSWRSPLGIAKNCCWGTSAVALGPSLYNLYLYNNYNNLCPLAKRGIFLDIFKGGLGFVATSLSFLKDDELSRAVASTVSVASYLLTQLVFDIYSSVKSRKQTQEQDSYFDEKLGEFEEKLKKVTAPSDSAIGSNKADDSSSIPSTSTNADVEQLLPADITELDKLFQELSEKVKNRHVDKKRRNNFFEKAYNVKGRLPLLYVGNKWGKVLDKIAKSGLIGRELAERYNQK